MSRAFAAAIHGTCVAHVSWDIESDPVLTGTRLIAEAWLAAGLYQVGSIGGDAGRSGTGGSAMTCVGS
jgi:pullulanase/glycogen debranching enzyme